MTSQFFIAPATTPAAEEVILPRPPRVPSTTKLEIAAVRALQETQRATVPPPSRGGVR